jgi:hypothetical protein
MQERSRGHVVVPGVLLAFILGGMVGCQIRQADLTAISTRNVSLDRVDLDKLQGSRVHGEDSAFVFLFIPFGFPHLEDAIDEALNRGGGDLLTDAVVHQSGWWFIVGQSTITVDGVAVKTRGSGAEGGTGQ